MTKLQTKTETTATRFLADMQEGIGAEGWAETVETFRNTDESTWCDHFGNRLYNEIYFATEEWVAAGADLGVIGSDDEAEDEAHHEKVAELSSLLKAETVKVIKTML